MLLNLTDLSQEPLQSQIARQIRAKILSGEIGAEEMLPSIRALAREHRVSVVTVQRGYEQLEREGLIHSRRGKGFFVSRIRPKAKKKMAAQRFKERIEPLIKIAIEEGMEPAEIVEAINVLLEKLDKD